MSVTKVDRAEELGYVVKGWHIEDYLRDAINHHGWESWIFWGPKGGYKSCFGLQILFMLYKNWDTALDYTILGPEDFIKVTDTDNRIPAINADDISSWLPRSLYFTHRKLWSEFKKNWDIFRCNLSVFICSTPQKEKVASFILDDASGEIFFGKTVEGKPYNIYDCQRWIWALDIFHPKKSQFEMVRIDKEAFPMTPEVATTLTGHSSQFPGVPTWVFKKYWERKLENAREAKHNLHEILKELNGKLKMKTIEPDDISKAASLLAKRSHRSA